MRKSDSGVALIVVLGIMAILAVIAVAFSKAMRDQRLAARNYADQIRAEHLVHAGVATALDFVDATMRGDKCYPFFSGGDAYGSRNSNEACSLFIGEARDMIPLALHQQASNVICNWIYVVGTNNAGGSSEVTMTNGRVAFLIVNCSGLLDANCLDRLGSQNQHGIMQLDATEIDTDIADAGRFISDRDQHVRYDTVAELAMNDGIAYPSSNLFVYSYDINRDVYFTNRYELGTTNIGLLDKFRINGITNTADCPAYASDAVEAYRTELANSGSWLTTNYWRKLTDLLIEAQYGYDTDTNPPTAIMHTCATSTAWNIINYLDEDTIPQTGSTTPWLGADGCEPTPLINEVVLSVTSPLNYTLTVELWFPFYPVSAAPGEYGLRIFAFTNDPVALAGASTIPTGSYHLATNHLVAAMSYTNAASRFGLYSLTNILLGTNGPAPVSSDDQLWFIARVTKNGAIVDQAMTSGTNAFSDIGSYSVKQDPRLNAYSTAWGKFASNTLGRINEGCQPWTGYGQGLPIFFRNEPMQSIDEVCHVFMPYTPAPPTNPVTFGVTPWQSVRLTDYYSGAAFVEWMTVRPATTNPAVHGLVHPNTQQRNALAALFGNARVRDSDNSGVMLSLTPTDRSDFANAMDEVSMNLRSLFYYTGRNTHFDALPLEYGQKEDALRSIVEMLTLRQNIFTIIIAAQALSKDGRGVLAEKRAMAIVYRDSYTGQSFVRLFKWLSK